MGVSIPQFSRTLASSTHPVVTSIIWHVHYFATTGIAGLKGRRCKLKGMPRFNVPHVNIFTVWVSWTSKHANQLNESGCAAGQPFSVVLASILSLLQGGAQMACHNRAHEALVMCRELQKLNLTPASPLLESLYSSHCTLIIAKRWNNGYYR